MANEQLCAECGHEREYHYSFDGNPDGTACRAMLACECPAYYPPVGELLPSDGEADSGIALPVRYDPATDEVRDASDKLICDTWDYAGPAIANALNAQNAVTALVEAAEFAREACRDNLKAFQYKNEQLLLDAINQLDAALAAVKGESK